VDDGRLADVDRKLALVRHVTPVGKSHLQRIVTTALKLLATADGHVPPDSQLAHIYGDSEQVGEPVMCFPRKHCVCEREQREGTGAGSMVAE
jgi:hypothetical protein